MGYNRFLLVIPNGSLLESPYNRQYSEYSDIYVAYQLDLMNSKRGKGLEGIWAHIFSEMVTE
jgi:hypothetical protein